MKITTKYSSLYTRWYGSTSRDVHAYLNDELPHRWTGRVGRNDLAFLRWPHRSPDLTPCDFFLWVHIKDIVYLLLLPQTTEELKKRISDALRNIGAITLQIVLNELNYRLDLCRVTKGEHIEHL